MSFFKDKILGSVWGNLLLMFLLAVVIYLVFFSSLDRITNHGEQMKVPVLIGKKLPDALKQMKDEGFAIDIDSTYDMKKPAGVILSQLPDTGSFVKKGRTIFIVANKVMPPLIAMPNLKGLSYRSARMLIKSSKLRLKDTVHKPDIADGAILEQLIDDEEVKEGDLVPQGSGITLVVGDGLGNTEFDVPDVVDMNYSEGIAVLNALGLQFIDVWEGRITDSSTAIIYAQFPPKKNEFGGTNRIKEGEMIDIKIRQGNKVEDEF